MTFDLQIFALLFLNCLVIIGFNKATEFEWLDDEYPFLKKKLGAFANYYDYGGINEQTAMIFWRIRYYSITWFGDFWSKPICTCPACMSSLHSIYVYWVFMPLNLHSLIIYPIYILALAGFVYSYSTVVLKD